MKLLVLPGDDIGPEIVPVAVEVLEAVNRKFGLGVELTYAKVGRGLCGKRLDDAGRAGGAGKST